MIALNNDYRINRCDEQNLILEKRRIKQTGNDKGAEYWQIVGYYGTHKSALNGFIKMELRLTNQDIYTLLAKIDELQDAINALNFANES